MNPMDTKPARDTSSLIGRTCPVCGENQVITHHHQDSFEYGSGESAVTLHVELPVRRCEACEFEFLDQEGERIKQEAVCRHLGVLTSTEIRGIRERYRMTRASFAELTGLGEATLNRWENGVLIQNRANDRYLRLLAMPDIFDRLSHLSDRPFSSQQLDFEAGDSRHEFSKAAVPITKRPPAALADVHLKSYGGWDSPDMSAASKQMTLFSKVLPRETVKGIPVPTRVVRRTDKDRDHAKPTRPIKSILS